MNVILNHINLLGLKGKDRITGVTGIITSAAFDLYGCMQVVLNPGMGQDGKLGDPSWFDSNRIEILSPAPVMPVPDFGRSPGNKVAATDKGPAEKPAFLKM